MSEKHFNKVMGRVPPGLKARSNMVIWMRVIRGETPTGVAVGEGAVEGFDAIVVSAGDKAPDLQPGDLIVINGKKGQEYDLIPNSRELFIVAEQHVLYTYGNVLAWPEDYVWNERGRKGGVQTS